MRDYSNGRYQCSGTEHDRNLSTDLDWRYAMSRHLKTSGLTRGLLLCLLPILIASSVQAAAPKNPNFDLSSVREFWPILDTLTGNREPDAQQWQRLFDSTGHNTLRREFTDEFFMRYLRAAYMPDMLHLKEEIIEESDAATGWFKRWFPRAELEALAWTLENRDKVEAEVRSLETQVVRRGSAGELAVDKMKGRDKAADEIKAFGDLLTAIARNPDSKVEKSQVARRTITRSGHIAGFYMSELIFQHFSREMLAQVARNPFELFYLYNEAAMIDGKAPAFSDEAI